MHVLPLVAGAALAVSACSGGSTTDSNDLAVDTLTVENLVVDDASPAAANVLPDAPSQAAAVEPAPTTAAPAVRNRDSQKDTSEAAARTETPPKTRPAPEPEPDPHAGHDMNSMNGM